LTGSERLDERDTNACCSVCAAGDPHDDLLGAWLAKESGHDIYLTERAGEAKVLLKKAIVGCKRSGAPDAASPASSTTACESSSMPVATWSTRPSSPRIITRAPYFNA
jgi:hypothetical protein